MKKLLVVLFLFLVTTCSTFVQVKRSPCYKQCCAETKNGFYRLGMMVSEQYINDTCESYCTNKCENWNKKRKI